MSLIDRTGTFRGRIVDHGVSKSTGGYPQWIASLIASEYYDVEEQVWVDWSEYDVNEITTYLVLFGGKGETLNSQQVKKVTGWNGNSFAELNGLNLDEVGIQFRVEENTYEGKTSLQVAWIDEYDATPGRTVRKLNPDELTALDTQYAKFLKQSGKKVTPAKAPKQTTIKGKGPIDPVLGRLSSPQVKAKGIKPTQPKGPVKKVKKSNDPLGPGASPVAPLPALPDPDLPTGHCTKDEAWGAVNDLKEKNVSDEKIANIWLGACQKVAPGTEQDAITDEQWFQVKEIVLAETSVF